VFKITYLLYTFIDRIWVQTTLPLLFHVRQGSTAITTGKMKTNNLLLQVSSLLLLLSSCSVPVPPTTIPTVIPPITTSTAILPTESPTTTQLPIPGTQPENNPSGSNGAPVILLMTNRKGSLGDIYTWNVVSQTLKQLTTWGYNFAPHVSPDGKWLAYRSVSQAAVSAITQGQAVNADDLANIWLLNPDTDDAVQITVQPEGATSSGSLIRRGEPAWSPDGTAVAWIEDSKQVAMYTLETKITTSFPLNLPPACCEGAGAELYWGRSGVTITNQEGTPVNSQQMLYIFNPQGQQLAKLTPGGNFFLQYGWIMDSNKHEYLGGDVGGVLTTVDPPGSAQPVTPQGYPEMYSPMAPDELSIHPAKNPSLWTITRHGHSLADINNIKDATDISIAPDGQGIVYRPNAEGEALPGDNLFIYLANGQTVPIIIPQTLRVLGITWGATAWRIHN
jgi:Tol biopolymer transport system component